MSIENQNPNASSPEMYQIPASQSDEIRHHAAEFASSINEQLKVDGEKTFIDVEDVPGHEERLEVRHEPANQGIGSAAVEHATRSVPISEATPQMMRKAIGTPYYQNGAGQIVPKN